jgi:tetratricopeptide (TPR) repeat protein
MKRKSQQRSGRNSQPAPTLAEMPFRELVQTDAELRKLREEYAAQPAKQRRMAAQWAYDSAHALMLVASALKESGWADPSWHDSAAPLAIDPDYAAAILTVGSLEYHYGRVDEAMLLFLQLTTLRTDLDELPEIIDRAGEFLIDAKDLANAERLYAAAVSAFPQVALYHAGLGYCAGKNGRKEEAVAHAQRAVDLEPENCRLLNDLGYSLIESRQYEEAEKTLRRAVELAPADYTLPAGNLEYLMQVRTTAGHD